MSKTIKACERSETGTDGSPRRPLELQPTKEDLAIGRALGQRVATFARKLRADVNNIKN